MTDAYKRLHIESLTHLHISHFPSTPHCGSVYINP